MKLEGKNSGVTRWLAACLVCGKIVRRETSNADVPEILLCYSVHGLQGYLPLAKCATCGGI